MNYNYSYSVKIEPIFLVIAPCIAAALFLWSKRKTIIKDGVVVGHFRPLAGLYIDLFFITLVMAPIFLIPLGLEYLATGKWVWSVERNFSRPTDIALVAIILLIFVALHCYLKWAAKAPQQTVGQHLMGFKIEYNNLEGSLGLIQYIGWALPNFIFRSQSQKRDQIKSQIKAYRVQVDIVS